MNDDMSIGEVARRSGVPPKTIRYYEDIGLVPAAERAANGYRVYDEVALHLLRFVKRARDFGFSIEETGELLELWRDPTRASGEVKRIAEARMRDIDRKITELEDMKRTLSELAYRCHGDRRPDCPILEAIAEPDDQEA